MSDNLRSAVIGALIGGVLGIGGSIGATLTGYWLDDPAKEKLEVMEAIAVRELSDTFVDFLAARNEMMQQLEAPFPTDEPDAQAYRAKTKNLVTQWKGKVYELAAALRFAEHTFDENTNIIIKEFIDWHEDNEEKRVGKFPVDWIPNSDYQDWRHKILVAATNAIN